MSMGRWLRLAVLTASCATTPVPVARQALPECSPDYQSVADGKWLLLLPDAGEVECSPVLPTGTGDPVPGVTNTPTSAINPP